MGFVTEWNYGIQGWLNEHPLTWGPVDMTGCFQEIREEQSMLH